MSFFFPCGGADIINELHDSTISASSTASWDNNNSNGADWRCLLGYEFSTIDIVDVFPVS